MQSFIEYLAEGRIAPLYHGTNLLNLKEILEHGLKPDTSHMTTIDPGASYGTKMQDTEYHKVKGISLTRNKNFAAKWGAGCVIEFDQMKLSHNYKIVPWQYWSGQARNKEFHHNLPWTGDLPNMNEFEEFLMTNKPVSLARYARCIWLSKYYKITMPQGINELCAKMGLEIKHLETY